MFLYLYNILSKTLLESFFMILIKVSIRIIFYDSHKSVFHRNTTEENTSNKNTFIRITIKLALSNQFRVRLTVIFKSVSILSVFGMKIRCLKNFKKHFWIFLGNHFTCVFFFKKNTSKFLKYSKSTPKWFLIFSFPFTHASLLHSPPPSLSIRDYTIGKTLHFHSTSLIGSEVTLYSFFVFLFLFLNVYLS